MKLIPLIILMLLTLLSVLAHEASAKGVSKKQYPKLITFYAEKYKLERTYLSCIYKIESEYRVNVISKTEDYGIGQINKKTAIGFKFDLNKLITDVEYSMDKSAYVLAYYKWLMAIDEPVTWMCRYNIGPGSIARDGRGTKCVNYLERFYGCANGDLKGVL